MNITTSGTIDCNGEKGETICVWERVKYTSWDGYNALCKWKETPDDMECYRRSDNFRVTAPNHNPQDSELYCVVGHCRRMWDHYFESDVEPTA